MHTLFLSLPLLGMALIIHKNVALYIAKKVFMVLQRWLGAGAGAGFKRKIYCIKTPTLLKHFSVECLLVCFSLEISSGEQKDGISLGTVPRMPFDIRQETTKLQKMLKTSCSRP